MEILDEGERKREKNTNIKNLRLSNIHARGLPEDPVKLLRFLFAKFPLHSQRTDNTRRFNTLSFALCRNSVVPNRGIASETWGRVSATRFRNTVSDNKMVTPETVVAHLCSMIRSRSSRPFADSVDERPSSRKTRSPIDGRSSFLPVDRVAAIVDEEKSTGAEPRRANGFHG